MSNRARRWMTVLALGGLVAAGISTYVHAQVVTDPGYTTFCDINARISCTDVYQSRYGSLAGVPVAVGGVIWFVGVLLLAFAGTTAPAGSQPNVSGYLLVWSTAGLAVAMYMAYASFVVLQVVCMLCVVVYVAVVGIFVVSGIGASTPVRRLPAAAVADLRYLTSRPVGLGLVVSFVVVAAGSTVWFTRVGEAPAVTAAAPSETAREPGPPAATPAQQSEFERFWDAQPRVDPALLDLTPDPETRVVVVKFNDYQCPACANTHLLYGPIFAKYESSHPGAVALITRDYPLDPECNDGSPNGPHGAACEAAVAVRLADSVGADARREMEEWLYANQPTLSRDSIVTALGDVAGVDAAQFDTAYDVEIARVRADIVSGTALPVEATPTYVINGVVLKGGLAPQFFDAAIAFELARAEGAP